MVKTRVARLVLGAVLSTLVLVPLGSSSPAGAAPQPFSLSMTEGQLRVRAAEAPLALETPTTVTGQHDTGEDGTGAVTDADMSTPTISFQTETGGITVFVDASFSSVVPGSGTGTIDSEGNVSLDTEVRVDLDLHLNSPDAEPIPCTASPVSLSLDSDAPWDPETGLVTLRDADFTIPPAADTPDCPSAIRERLDPQLAGAGNSIVLTLQGDLTLPPAPGCPSITDLVEVDPTTSFQGDEVALAATVVPDPAGVGTPECEDAVGVDPTGTVEFRAGGQVVALAELDADGRAEATTTTIPVGDQVITARYRGTPPYSGSTSDPVSHLVSARPDIVADIPPSFVVGTDPTEFDVTVTNNGLGAEIVNARLDVTFVRADGTSLQSSDLELERFDGDSWVPVALDPGTPYGSAMADTGVLLPVGGEVTQRLRLAVADSPGITGGIRVIFELVPVDPTTGDPDPTVAPADAAIASTEVRTAFVRDARQPADLQLLDLYPHTLRQGMVVSSLVGLAAGQQLIPTGTIRMYLDGQPVLIRSAQTPPDAGYQLTIPVEGLTAFPETVLPPDARTGTREVTIEYSGDTFYEPDLVRGTITVLPKRGAVYECGLASVFTDRIFVNVTGFGILPNAVPAGTDVPVRQLDVRMYADRGDASDNFGSFFSPENPVLEPGSPDDGFTRADIGFGDLGVGTAETVTFDNASRMDDSTRPEDPAPDQVIGFGDESATITVDGEPGEVVPVELESIDLSARLFGGFITVDLSCTPVGAPVSLGDVTVAGTTLAVDAPEPTREGDAVTLDATVAPTGVPGTVEFRDGSETIGTAPVTIDGTASLTTTSLEVGEHSLTAIFRGGSFTLPSGPVTLEVLPEFDCPTFVAEGAGRAVRWAYLTVVRRCPDQAGFAFWTPRYEASPADFARSFTGQRDATRALVDDGYRMVLARSADSAGREYWTDRLRAGYRYDRFLAALAGSPEMSSGDATSPEGFVTRLYDRLLRRAPEPAGLDYWAGQIESGVPRWRVALYFTATPEVLGRLVTDAYQRVLDRAPSTAERTAGVLVIRRTGSLNRVYAELLATPEFASVADDLPNP